MNESLIRAQERAGDAVGAYEQARMEMETMRQALNSRDLDKLVRCELLCPKETPPRPPPAPTMSKWRLHTFRARLPILPPPPTHTLPLMILAHVWSLAQLLFACTWVHTCFIHVTDGVVCVGAAFSGLGAHLEGAIVVEGEKAAAAAGLPGRPQGRLREGGWVGG
jgi:hypothetical protein